VSSHPKEKLLPGSPSLDFALLHSHAAPIPPACVGGAAGGHGICAGCVQTLLVEPISWCPVVVLV
jgi:hypothetical protein